MADVKCLVCGVVFDDSLGKCPVCGVGLENTEPVQAAPKTEAAVSSNKRFLILGGGIAAVSAAEAIRAQDSGCSITILSGEGRLPFKRTLLTKCIAEGLPEDAEIYPADWYKEKKITVETDKLAMELDPVAHRVRCADGSIYYYDKLIYALGAYPFVPEMDGVGLEQVQVIRLADDVVKIRELLAKGGRALVVGDGVLGLEAAWSIRKYGCPVTVLGSGKGVMGKQLDAGGSEVLEAIMAKKGLDLKKNARSEAVLYEGDRVTGIRLKDGEEVPGDLVILSTGVRPNTFLAVQAGLEVNKSIVVNDKMETSAPDIYACGDCAEWRGINYSLWSEATEQGRVAGTNAAGGDAAYGGVEGAVIYHGMDIGLFSAGDKGGKEGVEYDVVEKQKDLDAGVYEKYYFRDGRFCGVILIGDTSAMGRLTKQLAEGAPKEEVL